jgi:hypothetical protein
LFLRPQSAARDAPLMRKASGCGCGHCAACSGSGVHLSEPGDSLERDADAVADQVMRGTHGPARPQAGHSAVALPGGLVPSGGRGLDAVTRAWMEPRFGARFDSVRVHDGPEATQHADAFAARAYTVGEHMVFGAGEYRPDSDSGRQLIAHELAHVVQGRRGGATAIRRKEDWNFTPADYTALKKRKRDLRLAADSSFVPRALCVNILNTLRYALDEKLSPAATEGINDVDFYHGHLAVPNTKKGLSIDLQEARTRHRREFEKRTIETLGGEYDPVTPKNVAAYTASMKTNVLPLLGKAMEEWVKFPGAAVMYHSYETTALKKGIAADDPRRNMLTPLDTNTPQPYSVPKGMTSWTDQYISYMEFTFLVDQQGEVHVRSSTRDSMSTITGAPVTRVP